MIWGLPLLMPANRLGAFAHAILQPARLDDLRHWLAPFTPDAAEWVLVPRFHGILQPELNGVEGHFAGDALDVRVHRERSLRHTIATKGARRRRVRVHNVRVEADVRRV